ncbi:hypothetical protein AIOL_003385 [Candidatus Rhodobacter oscarellae]|uniref:Uncharacterized protein n=1 Tax=Candidatus Rhodobacter oscarellae TaxID=1675527 RepID=A0A0J9E6U3_9RHOB|nr:hypothetical protein [Candidatus Rhodobacter lobularis]KMW58412.1 hypothetical protein AIOL_003385 [Candidatus Rhodobacter lobularis]
MQAQIRAADKIVVMAQGRVVEHGPHDELVGRNWLYAQLHKLQFKG